jgi:hypothetical protein
MLSDLVPLMHYVNGEISWGGEKWLDLSKFKFFDTRLNLVLDYSQKQVFSMLGCMNTSVFCPPNNVSGLVCWCLNCERMDGGGSCARQVT